MKPRLNIRELPPSDYFPEHGEVAPVAIKPFVLVDVKDKLTGGGFSLRKTPIWLEYFDGYKHETQHREAWWLRVHNSACYGMPISRDQTITNYSALKKVGKNGVFFYRSFMLGICEQLRSGEMFGGNVNDDGEVYLIKASFKGLDFYSVWADSHGAAMKLCRQCYDENGPLWEAEGIKQPPFEECIAPRIQPP